MFTNDPPTWILRLFGDFELLNPDGVVIKLPTRKAEGLFAILALSRPEGISRVEAAQILWPEHGLEKRQANLRQALAKIHRAVGAGVVVASRDRCRLSDTLEIQSDAFDPTSISKRSQSFMPNFGEPWFRARRQSLGAAKTDSEGSFLDPLPMPLEGFLQLLRWYADSDPRRAVDLLRSNPDLSVGLHPRDIQGILKPVELKLRPSEPLYGWLLHCKALNELEFQNLKSARPMARTAADIGRDDGDYFLEIESEWVLAVIDILTGHLDRAQVAVNRAIAVAQLSGNQLLVARGESLAGTLYVHQGRIREGLARMEQATEGYEHNVLEYTQNDALRALYHATAGELQAADRLLHFPERIVRETRHFRLDMICSLTRSIIASKASEHDVATKLLDTLIARSLDGSSTHFEIYAREAFAVTAWKQRERADAQDQLRASERLRKTIGMSYSGWDLLRLSELKTKY